MRYFLGDDEDAYGVRTSYPGTVYIHRFTVAADAAGTLFWDEGKEPVSLTSTALMSWVGASLMNWLVGIDDGKIKWLDELPKAETVVKGDES